MTKQSQKTAARAKAQAKDKAAKKLAGGRLAERQAKKAAAVAKRAAEKKAGQKAAARAKALVAAKNQAAVKEKAKDTANLRKLKPFADELNHRMKKGEENSTAIKLQFVAAKELCKKLRVPWQKWAETNLKYSIRHINRVIAIETDADPEQAALADQTKNRDAVAKTRARARAEEQDGKSQPLTKFEQADQLLAGMTDKDQHAVASSRMSKLGFVVVQADEFRAVKAKAGKKGDGVIATEYKAVMKAFLELKAAERVQFVRAAADHIGFSVTDPFEGQHKDDTGGIPPVLDKRGKGKGTVAERAAAGSIGKV